MAELSEEILEYLNANAFLDSWEHSKAHNLDHQKVIGAIKSLQTTEGVSSSL